MTALLDVQDLKTSFFAVRGEVQAVRAVSLQVRPGEPLGIVGAVYSTPLHVSE